MVDLLGGGATGVGFDLLMQAGAEALANLFRNGEKLVRKCMEIKWWNAIKKYSHMKKLEKYEASLLWFFQINVQVELSRDGKTVAVGVKVLEEKMDKIISTQDNGRSVNSNGFSGWCGVPEVRAFVVGLDAQLQELKGMLLKDGVPIVVLSAPGGCGKTTLGQDYTGIYGNNIFFQTVSTVSIAPNLQLMVQKVFQSKKNQQVPIFQSDEDAINQLEQLFLQQVGPAPILLVLDDMWLGSESLIDQFLLPIHGYKILVTSRFVFPQFEWTYKLNMLNHQDAMTLFHHHAFKDGICTVQKHLVEERGCILEFQVLQKLLFLILIPPSLNIKDDQDANDYCKEHFVMQHDLLRELAVHQSSQGSIEGRERLIVEINGNAFPEWLTDRNHQPINVRILSITTDNAFCSNWSNVQIPDVKVLILNFQVKIYTLPEFMERMSCLAVLLVTNYGFTRAILENFPLPSQLNNLKRLWLENISIPSIAPFILQLKNLQKISMITCEIGKAFEVCPISISNTWPNLNEINIEYCDDLVEIPAWVCGLVHLKKIKLGYCQELVTLPPELGNLTNLEVLRLQSCTQLLELPESISGLRELKYLDLSDCVEMDHLPERLGDLCGLQIIRMMGCTALSELPPSVMDLVQLERVICDNEIAYLWKFYKDYLDKLEIVVVKEDVNLNWLHKRPA
ncbi:probable disease resistance At5g66900 [Olea europaea subsp. europaea]|uniref:Probable disease resistance At5g66900 n=1 Tax=Olea europaea subsp. europaea TaxID=158383 RepID=A0A8S0Q8I5_OLEEU|nr:probable disease resistance At5g66900 [Olea europaea subsp. europaea]